MATKIVIKSNVKSAPSGRKQSSGHTKAKAPIISLAEPGRLRVAHILCLFGISHSTFYAGVKTGRYPRPDGKDGKLPYWKTQTIRKFLEV